MITLVLSETIPAPATDYEIEWSNENSKDVGSYTVTARGTKNFTGVTYGRYVIESMETWNLFEDGSEHVCTVSGITSKNEVVNSNTSSAKYFTAVLSKVKLMYPGGVTKTVTIKVSKGKQ
ncbi:MAG: hypothetical protein IJT37_12670 [Lachnospiraceae bacterium]|nr:hypothetical protein [Lachnospiraceae bacterium]